MIKQPADAVTQRPLYIAWACQALRPTLSNVINDISAAHYRSHPGACCLWIASTFTERQSTTLRTATSTDTLGHARLNAVGIN